MAITLEFINLIVPIATIRRKYPGGWTQCLADHAEVLGRRVWHDEHLFRDGTMSPRDMQWLVGHWEQHGLQPFEVIDGRRRWKDLCVVEPMFGGPTLECDWLAISRRGDTVWLAGTDPGPVACPDERREH
jgi:hypothetical protein